MAITSSVYHRWLYGRTVCSMYAFCGMLFGLCSLTTLTLLSVVCFVKVCYPLYGNRFTSFHGRLLIACAWFYALLFACSPLVHWGEYGPEPYGTACCIDWRLSNQHATARSYTVALFIFCYILPCCVIVASYTGILITVQASRKTMEQHSSRETHMSSIQTIIVKLSVAVCIGFFAAWSPYALVSMWAAFGQIENIPPLAFAMPAMFAKSSTIYNPIIYLLLRPNFRRIMWRDVGELYHNYLKGCFWSRGQTKCCTKIKIRVRLRTTRRQTSRFPSSVSPPIMTIDQRCEDTFTCFRHYPTTCAGNDTAADGDTSVDEETPVSLRLNQTSEGESSRKSLMATVRTTETNNFHISLEMIPRVTKEAWP
ncbi:opsin 7, group member a isoform X3 [Oryzias melastigma]|nr:opsin 7, group member a isoform X3 [Oryzias melastigma]XP_024128956.1 opsin 7, group member a isoform X3 [Oryzias melastigma]XP_024128957.1 opsin 7, group member a isoform X3 [Oryzias melastigma]